MPVINEFNFLDALKV